MLEADEKAGHAALAMEYEHSLMSLSVAASRSSLIFVLRPIHYAGSIGLGPCPRLEPRNSLLFPIRADRSRTLSLSAAGTAGSARSRGRFNCERYLGISKERRGFYAFL